MKRPTLRVVFLLCVAAAAIVLVPSRFRSPQTVPAASGPVSASKTELVGNRGLLSVDSLARPHSNSGESLPATRVASKVVTASEGHRDFLDWADRYGHADAQTKAALLTEGRKLAEARRAAMLEEIRSNPENALALATPWQVRRALPEEVTGYLEQPVSGRGSIDTHLASPRKASAGSKTGQGIVRMASIDGATYDAYVYGRRVEMTSVENVPLHGVAIGNSVALSESPLRTLGSAEAKSVLDAGVLPPSCSCQACGGTASSISTAVVLENAGGYFAACSPEHARDLQEAFAQVESRSVTSRRIALHSQSNPTNPPPATLSTNFATQKVLLIPVYFPNDIRIPITYADAAAKLKAAGDFLAENTYNKAGLVPTVAPAVAVGMPKDFYNTGAGGARTLFADAKAAAKLAGFPSEYYDFVLVVHTDMPSYNWSTIAMPKGGVMQETELITFLEQVGFLFNLSHANFWDTRRGRWPDNTNNLPYDITGLIGRETATGPGDDLEFGDMFDIMGSAGGRDTITFGENIDPTAAHFNVVSKWNRDWLPANNVRAVAMSTTNRVYAFDAPTLVDGRSYSLVVSKDAQRDYWISARSRITNSYFVQNGVELHWGLWPQVVYGSAHLIDTTPDTKLGREDSAILVGRTFYDEDNAIAITPIARGGSGVDLWYDVVVNKGPFPSNQPPVVTLTGPSGPVAERASVSLSASATDPNGDRMAYFWDFGDGSFGGNSNAVTHAFTDIGEYVVRCEVSDLRGGMTAKQWVVTVGAPSGHRVSGTIVDSNGKPLQNVRVSNGSVNGTEYGADYQVASTDSEGFFTLVNLANGNYTLTAFRWGYNTIPLNFYNPVGVADADATGLKWVSTPYPRVKVERVNDATAPSSAGSFKFTRTGDATNTALTVFVTLGGTAVNGVDFGPLTNSVSQTNITDTLESGVTRRVYTNFFTVDFATGVFTTNITILPAPSATNGERQVICTIMHPMQFIRMTATETNAVDFPGWEVRTVSGADSYYPVEPTYCTDGKAEASLNIRSASSSVPALSIAAYDAVATEGAGDSASFIIIRSGKADVALTIPIKVEGTARPGIDYEALPESVTLASGQMALLVPVRIRPDSYLDGNTTLKVILQTSSAYTLSQSTAQISIMDNDLPMVRITALDPLALERSRKPATLLVTRAGDLTAPLTVRYLVGGSGVSGVDFRALPGSVTIPANQYSTTLLVEPRDNGQRDRGVTVDIQLSDLATYNVGTPGSVTVFIQDAALATLDVSSPDTDASEPADPATVTITRTGDVSRQLLVGYRLAGPALPLVDFAGIGDKIVIPAGVDSVNVTIMPIDDPYREDPETVTLEILPGLEYNLTTNFQATLTINDNDSGLPSVGFMTLESSGLESIGTTSIPIRASAAPAEETPINIDYRVTGGTAIQGVDFGPVGSNGVGHMTFGATLQYLKIPIIDNTNVDGPRTIQVTLFEPFSYLTNEFVTNEVAITNAAGEQTGTTNIIETNTVIVGTPINGYLEPYQVHTFTILDNDGAVVDLETVNGIAYEEGGEPALLRLHRSGPTNRAQVIKVALGGYATYGADYHVGEGSVAPTTFTIPIGDIDLDIPIVPVDDQVQEYMESLQVMLLEVPGAAFGTKTNATVSIIDNDGTMEFAAQTYHAVEGDGMAEITVRRTTATNRTDTIRFAASAGTAVSGVDFVATNGVLTFLPGQTSQVFQVEVLDNATVDNERSVSLTLSDPTTGAPIGGQASATLLILDNETMIEFSKALFEVAENATNATVTVRRSGKVSDTASVLYAVTNDTAISGVDFVGTNGVVNFLAGQTEATFKVRILDNGLMESNRVAALQLYDPTNSVLGSLSNATVVIRDDECVLEFSAATTTVPEFGRTVSLSVIRLGSSINPVTVSFETSDGIASSGSDYQTLSGALTFRGETNYLSPSGNGVMLFEPGETNKTIVVRVFDDNVGEGDEDFYVTLRNPRSLVKAHADSTVLGTNSVIAVTIVDDEVTGQLDYAFNPGSGANGPVYTLALQSDDKVLLGGAFTRVDGVDMSNLARLHSDGYLDSFLNGGGGPNGRVLAIALQADGRILVGGEFTQVNGAAARYLVRLNADGTTDPGFAVTVDARVRAIAVQPDGAILLAGDFTTVGGESRARLARVAWDGTLDTHFNPPGPTDGEIYTLALQPDGKILVGGAFQNIVGVKQPYLGRLNADGTLDRGFGVTPALDDVVRSLALDAEGRILVGGDFKTVAGKARAGVAMLSTSGALDSSFDPGTGADASVRGVGVTLDGKVVVVGAFTNFAGVSLNRFARLNPNGSIDTSFENGSGANAIVHCLLLQPDTAFVIGGEFTEVNGVSRSRIARIHGDEKFVPKSIQFSESSYSVSENATQAVVKVIRSGDLVSAVSVDYRTEDLTATAGEDYETAAGTLSFQVGETEKEFTVRVMNDTIAQGDRQLQLLLTNLPSGYTRVARLSATLTIRDDESAVSFTSDKQSATESVGTLNILVRRSGLATNQVSVDYRAIDGSATNGIDYVLADGTLVFNSGEAEKNIPVVVLNNSLTEPDRNFVVELLNPVGGAVLGKLNQISVTITDDDRQPTYSLNITPPVGGEVYPASGPYPNGSVQTLTAVPDFEYEFVKWEGTTNSTQNPLTVVMSRNYDLKAVFQPLAATYTFEPPFVATDLTRPPWSSQGTPWVLQSSVSASGQSALRSGAILDEGRSSLSLTLVTREGAVSFFVKVSSEQPYDGLEFQINGTRMQRWSGEVPWQQVQFPVGAGPNTLTWTYSKDANYSGGQDAAFLDDLFIPLVKPDTRPKDSKLGIAQTATGITITLTGTPGIEYILQSSEDLVTWTDDSTHLVTTGTVSIEKPKPAGPGARFYRAVSKP